MNQDNNFNIQGDNTNNQSFNNYQQPIPQPTNTFESSNTFNQSFNNKPQKKINLGLIIGIVAVLVVAVIGIVLGSKLLSKKNETSNNNKSTDTEVIYYDNSRSLKDNYTFKEAVNKFAFKVSESTLIFEENDKTTFYTLSLDNTIHDELMNVEFNYKQDIYTSLGAIYLGESNSTTLEEFKSNFKSGILSDKTKWTVENVNIIDSNNEYVFASWTNKASVTTNEYYFAKQIGNKIYYAYNTSLTTLNDKKISLLLEEFKEFFTCLKEDDGIEPYIYDKIINVPVVLNKKIKDANSIYSISNNTSNGYLDGSVSFAESGVDFISLEYGASKHYDKIDWSENFNSNMKYTQEDDKNRIGIKDNDNTQIFNITIYSDKNITNKKEFNSYISKYFIEK